MAAGAVELEVLAAHELAAVGGLEPLGDRRQHAAGADAELLDQRRAVGVQALDVDVAVLDDEEAALGDEVRERLERRAGDLGGVGRVLDHEASGQWVDELVDALDRGLVAEIALDQGDLLLPVRVGSLSSVRAGPVARSTPITCGSRPSRP